MFDMHAYNHFFLKLIRLSQEEGVSDLAKEYRSPAHYLSHHTYQHLVDLIHEASCSMDGTTGSNSREETTGAENNVVSLWAGRHEHHRPASVAAKKVADELKPLNVALRQYGHHLKKAAWDVRRHNIYLKKILGLNGLNLQQAYLKMRDLGRALEDRDNVHGLHGITAHHAAFMLMTGKFVPWIFTLMGWHLQKSPMASWVAWEKETARLLADGGQGQTSNQNRKVLELNKFRKQKYPVPETTKPFLGGFLSGEAMADLPQEFLDMASKIQTTMGKMEKANPIAKNTVLQHSLRQCGPHPGYWEIRKTICQLMQEPGLPAGLTVFYLVEMRRAFREFLEDEAMGLRLSPLFNILVKAAIKFKDNLDKTQGRHIHLTHCNPSKQAWHKAPSLHSCRARGNLADFMLQELKGHFKGDDGTERLLKLLLKAGAPVLVLQLFFPLHVGGFPYFNIRDAEHGYLRLPLIYDFFHGYGRQETAFMFLQNLQMMGAPETDNVKPGEAENIHGGRANILPFRSKAATRQ